MAGKVPETNSGLTEDQAVEAGMALRQGFDALRSLQFNPTASILRYVVTEEGKPHLGIPDKTELVPGLADLPVLWSRVSTREVIASRGLFEVTDLQFSLYAEVKDTDEILFQGKTYKVIRILYWNPDIGRSMIVARAT